jgi:hypothetical protein
MRNLAKIAKVIAVGTAVTFGASNFVNAATISFGGTVATDNSGLTSDYIDPITGGGVGYFIETFDQATGDAANPGSTAYNDDYEGAGTFDDTCAVNSLNGTAASVGVTGDTSESGVRIGSIANYAAAPANDETCYAFVSNNGSGTATFEFDYSDLIAAYSDTGITYLGFYWGSVDVYNTFEFYSGGDLVTTITGSELLAELGGTSGDQVDDSSNVYVNIDFSFAEQFDTLVITTTGIAGEFDNIVIGLSSRPTPAPAGIALFAVGLIAAGVRSRFKK